VNDLRTAFFPLVSIFAACTSGAGPNGASFGVAVAPLSLPGVSKVCYDLRVTDGPLASSPVVWAEGDPAISGPADTGSLCSSAFGNGAGGDLTFVGSCVASPVEAGQDYRTNSVTLWVDSLYDSANSLIDPAGSNGWQNPCPSGCTLTAPCRENADTSVEFNLTILRQANQGFFDIGVNFEDVFCSAKVDCKNADGQPLELLFRPGTSLRDTTVVSAFACTGGAGATTDTILYRNDLSVTCGSTTVELSPAVGKGNAWSTDPNPSDAVFQYAIYAGDETLTCAGEPCNKRYWNVAFGFEDATPNCTLRTRMTASDKALDDFRTPSATTYPYVDIEVPLTSASALICGRHPLNVGSAVTTRYTAIDTPEPFAHQLDDSGFSTSSSAYATPVLTGVNPSTASVGDTIELAGTFEGPAVVNFPGGVRASARLLSPGRASVVIPQGATSGLLTVSVGPHTSSGLALTLVQFQLGLVSHGTSRHYDQGGYGRQMPKLNFGRQMPASAVIGNYLYIFGGTIISGGWTNTGSVERATINADGTLSAFSVVAGVTLTPRYIHTAAVVGDYVYVIGGATTGTDTLGAAVNVQRASIGADGSISTFATVPGRSLATPRNGHTSVVIGNYLYVLGGYNAGALSSIERAELQEDGTLGNFSTVAGRTLSVPRSRAMAQVIGDYLYVFGGTNEGAAHPDSVFSSVERAPILADGSLGTFGAVPGVTLSQRTSGASIARAGTNLYIFGGFYYASDGAQRFPATIQRATISGGEIATFVNVGNMTTDRYGAVAEVIKDRIYIISGYSASANVPVAHIEYASTNTSGGLANFSNLGSTSVTTPRSLGVVVNTGQRLHMIGGNSGGVAAGLASVESAAVEADGTIGSFSVVPGLSLASPRYAHSAAVIGNYVYVFGGYSGTADVLGVERASINPDGTLGPFASAGSSLTTGRYGASWAVIGDYLYAFGGNNGTGPLGTVERATIDSNHNLSNFGPVAGVGLTPTYENPPSAIVIKNYVYVTGLWNNVSTGTAIQRATIAADGTIGSFTTVGNLVTSRKFQQHLVVGPSFYVFGGWSGVYSGGFIGGHVDSVERATVNADGTLGAFSTVPGVTLTTPSGGMLPIVIGSRVHLWVGDIVMAAPMQ
jgi:hypothetical protein